MVNITLVCAAGMSTSMLVQKMKEAAVKQGVDIDIRAMAESAFKKYEGQTDILLLGPQISYLEDQFRTSYEPKGIRVGTINMMDYGMMNGEKVLAEALAQLD